MDRTDPSPYPPIEALAELTFIFLTLVILTVDTVWTVPSQLDTAARAFTNHLAGTTLLIHSACKSKY